jgi:hypothetical protein
MSVVEVEIEMDMDMTVIIGTAIFHHTPTTIPSYIKTDSPLR